MRELVFCSPVCVCYMVLFSHNLKVVLFCLLDHASEWCFFSFTFGGLTFLPSHILIFTYICCLSYLRRSDGPSCHLCKQIKIPPVYSQFRMKHSTLDPSPIDQSLQECNSLFSISPFNCLNSETKLTTIGYFKILVLCHFSKTS